MRPKAIPLLTKGQMKQLEEETKRKPTKKELETIKRAKERFKNCPL